jgi:nucleoside-diphosphate kinase
LIFEPGTKMINFFRKESIVMERTLSIVKPDGVARGLIGEVVKRFEKAGIRIAAMKMIHMTKEQAEGFYAVHKARPFFGSLTEFMSSGPAVVMVLEGENVIAKNRELMGATNYKDAAEGTIRRDFASDIEKNIVHGSDAPETAAVEIGYFFNQLEITG